MLGVTGELDIATAPLLRQAVAEMVSPHLRALTLDLAGLVFIDVAGLRALIDVRRAAKAAGVEFQLRSVSDSASYVIRLAGFDELADALEARTA